MFKICKHFHYGCLTRHALPIYCAWPIYCVKSCWPLITFGSCYLFLQGYICCWCWETCAYSTLMLAVLIVWLTFRVVDFLTETRGATNICIIGDICSALNVPTDLVECVEHSPKVLIFPALILTVWFYWKVFSEARWSAMKHLGVVCQMLVVLKGLKIWHNLLTRQHL